MEMESLRLPDQTETAGSGLSSGLHLPEHIDYKDAQVWKDIEKETGLASYADYLDFYKDVRPDFADRLKAFQELPKDFLSAEIHSTEFDRSSIDIYDLSTQEDSTVAVKLRHHCYFGTELIHALRAPPKDTCVQLVLWSIPRWSQNQEMVEALILGLRLDVGFLAEVDTISSPLPSDLDSDRSNVDKKSFLTPPNLRTFRPSQIKSIVGHGAVCTVSEKFMSDVADPVPVVLVAVDDGPETQTLRRLLARYKSEQPPFRRPSHKGSVLPPLNYVSRREKFGKIYVDAVEQFIAQYRNYTPTKPFQLLAAMSPLLHAGGYRITETLKELQDTYSKMRAPLLNKEDLDRLGDELRSKREALRRNVEEAEDLVGQTFRYLGSETNIDWSKETFSLKVRADWKSLVDDARRLETEVRDFMPLQVGDLALQESRNSIELSNLQITVSKKGKCAYYTFMTHRLTSRSQNLSV